MTAHILMSPPDYFTVDYAINPWMAPGSVDRDLAKRQWDSLHRALTRRARAKVSLMAAVEGLPDLVFTANAAFVYQNAALIARYKFPERRGEEPHCRAWFDSNGFRVVDMAADQFFEGAGDALIWRDRVFAGYKTRTDILSHPVITRETGLPILSMELIDPRFYHIDVCMCPLYNDYLIWFPEAFDEYGRRVVEANLPPDKLIAVSSEEAARFACNAVNVFDTVVMHQGNPRLADDLRQRHFQVIEVDLSEFLKAGGSAKCLTLRIG